MNRKKTNRVCDYGHAFFKSTDCPTCPVCEKNKTPQAAFHSKISAPAKRALERENILSLEKLSEYTENDLLALHGVGPKVLVILKQLLKAENLNFRNTPKKH